MNDCYSPHTGEHIITENPASWMGRAGEPCPPYDSKNQSVFWKEGGWVIEEVKPEPKPVPSFVTRRQGRLALLEAGKLSDIENAIANLTDPNEKLAAEIEYVADTWERENEFLQFMWQQLGGTEEELDNLFRAASEK